MSKMKKRTSMICAAVLSATVLVTTALAASNNVSGYEKLKASAFNIMTMKNYTVKMDFAMQLDGTDFATGNMEAKVEDESHKSSRSSYSMLGEINDSEDYTMGDIVVYKSWDGSYRSYKNYSYGYGSNDLDLTGNQKRLISAIFDMFAGDTKNYFTNDDGEISARLEKSQIPEFFQAGMAVLSDALSQEVKDNLEYMQDYYDEDDFEYKFLSVMNDMSFHSVYVDSYVDENDMLNKMECTVTISGKDERGKKHYLKVAVNCYISNIGTTVADTVDLDLVEDDYNYDDWYYDWDDEYDGGDLYFDETNSVDTLEYWDWQ